MLNIVGADKSRYEGEYKLGQKHGQGRYDWADGSYYMGEWQENKINGYGEYFWADGRGYKGDWVNNNMHGKGTYIWKDGRKYVGEYLHDRKHVSDYAIYSRAMECTLGQMVAVTRENGKMANNMGGLNTTLLMVLSR
jgi:hypothetical protein